MSEEAFSDYGYQKTLQEILEELSTYCVMNHLIGERENKIKIILPDKVIRGYNKIWYAKERIIIDGQIVNRNDPVYMDHIKNSILHVNGGTIALYSDKEYSITKKRKKK